MLWLLAASPGAASSDSTPRLETSPSSDKPLWEQARTCFDQAEASRDDKSRARAAQEGIASARQLLQANPNNAPAHYYLALNLGQLARTKKLAALKLVSEMEKELKKAAELDPGFDFAGPHRSLGLLYEQAPEPPLSVGNQNRAKRELEKAVTLAPLYPENRLCLLEFLFKRSPSEVASGLKEWDKQLPEMRRRFTGGEWEKPWKDWERRVQALNRKESHRDSRR